MKVSSTLNPSLIAFYLPQYHPIPENDEWWGKGFTEWTNVTKSKPLFDGHYQPHLPSDFGFYDLRLRETRREQIKLAKQYGIDGFCYYYYWFSGKRLLHQPIDDMLSDKESDMPFCLCWPNENWTRRWDGAEHEILIEQKYNDDDNLNFIKDISVFLKDSRYIKIDGAPLLIVYRPQKMPDSNKTLEVWREYCRDVGIGDIHLCAALTHGNEDYKKYGFDSGVEFPPHNLKIANRANKVDFYNSFKGIVFDYTDIIKYSLDKDYGDQNIFYSVFPSWDNTARRNENALIVTNSCHNNYEFWLNGVKDKTTKNYPDEQRFIFINAWNEWAEGCHLEPDRKYQHQYLESTLNVKLGKPSVDMLNLQYSSDDCYTLNQSKSFEAYSKLRNIVGNFLNKAPIVKKVLKRILPT